MKKTILLIFFAFILPKSYSQEISDAVRYGSSQLNGSARFVGMSGAFGALGGDISSINANPAGSAVFLRNQFGFTLSNYGIKNNTNYYNSQNSSNDSSLEFNQIGSIFVLYNPDSDSNWKKLTFGFNYENTNNFDNNIYSQGVNPTTSVANYFLSYANGVPLNVFESSTYRQLNYGNQQGFLGYQGYIINPLENDSQNTTYLSNVPNGGNYYQENFLNSTGSNGKLMFNMATQYKDKFYFGLNLNSNFVNYYQYTSFYESNNNSNSEGVKNLYFENALNTYGYGFSFQLGGIAKVTNNIRLGLTYESPTWYELNDELKQTLSSTGYNYGTSANPDLSSTTVDSDYITIYQPYNLHTPGKFTGSIAYVYKKAGLISFDYSYKDYGNTKYTSNDGNSGINNTMSNVLGSVNQFRLGAEYKIQQLSLRGGYRYEQSPYKNKQIVGDLNGFSTGLGYSFGPTKIDFAYAYSHVDFQQKSFSQGFTDGAKVKTNNNNFSLTLLYDF